MKTKGERGKKNGSDQDGGGLLRPVIYAAVKSAGKAHFSAFFTVFIYILE